MISIGQYNELTILRETSVGIFLGDDEGNDVLLPNKYCPERFRIGTKLNVFVYRDFEERIVATNIHPGIMLHEFAFLKVAMVTDVGAFLDWGLEKDLMVPFKEQRQKMEQGRWYVVYLDIDEESDRLFASNKIEKYLNNDVMGLTAGEEVDVLVYHKSDLGYNVIVNNRYKGLVFENEVFKQLNIGQRTTGFVKKIREDNKLDISLQAIGYKQYNDKNTEHLLNVLTENKGFLKLNDKSSPEEVYRLLGMSKKAFKKSLGALYKDRKVSIGDNGVSLVAAT